MLLLLLFLFIICILVVVSRGVQSILQKKCKKHKTKFDEKGGILLRIFDLTTLHTISNYIRQKTRKERECFCAREE
tara:strand:- start:1007 stop:1234 length:228 start_codon:yes stop_codon:yes gene_type:complete